MNKKNAAPTQNFIPIDQIREGVMIMKDKSLKGVMMVSSLNFALKSDEEQMAIIYQFQNFLNSLDFSCQIVVQSRRLNITGYIESLKEIESKQKNELLKVQTSEYRKFIEEIIEGGTIMTKNFFLVVPYYPMGEISKKSKNKASLDLTEDSFQRGKYQLWQRMEYVAMGIGRCGLKAAPLSTSEIIELLWSWHHQKEAEFGYYPELPPELTH